MNTQNTPIHPKLWHREFWLMAFANLLLSMAVYMLIPILPKYLMEVEGMSTMQVGIVMGAYVIGLFALGPLCSWLITRYRRNRVCLFSVLLMALSFTLYTHAHQWLDIDTHDTFVYALYRFILGVTFGLSQMILCSTLIVDVSESFQRTEANHSAAWFGRFALSLGPMAAILIDKWVAGGIYLVFDISFFMTLAGMILICMVKFPFKIPDENVSVFSFDRFFLPSGWLLFMNLVLIMIVLGILLTLNVNAHFYGMMMCGFFLALLSEKYVFANVEPKREAITGLVVMAIAILILLARPQAFEYISPTFLGLGIGIIGSRFLLYFIQLSLHCQRGTSQSTFFLAWESGMGIGLFLGYVLFESSEQKIWCVLVLIVLSFLMYMFVTHPWCMRHKHR